MGISSPLAVTYLGETCPPKVRGFVLASIWSFMAIGLISIFTLMYFISPNMKENKLPELLLAIGIVNFACVGFYSLFTSETPRYLIVNGDNDIAFTRLAILTQETISETTKKSIIHFLKDHGVNKSTENSWTSLFSNQFRLTTILLCLISFSASVITYGPALTFTDTLSKVQSLGEENDPQLIIINGIISGFGGMFGDILSGALIEISIFGRKRSMFMSCVFQIAALSCSIIYFQNFGLFMAFFFVVNTIVYNVSITYTTEVYPTVIREKALSFMFGIMQVGGVFSQVIFMKLAELSNIFLPYELSIFIVGVSSIAIYMLPFETYGEDLDTDYNDTSSKVKIN